MFVSNAHNNKNKNKDMDIDSKCPYFEGKTVLKLESNFNSFFLTLIFLFVCSFWQQVCVLNSFSLLQPLWYLCFYISNSWHLKLAIRNTRAPMSTTKLEVDCWPDYNCVQVLWAALLLLARCSFYSFYISSDCCRRRHFKLASRQDELISR